jgi:hypothetical protein
MLNFCALWWPFWPFSKLSPQYRTYSTLFDFNVLNWFPTSKNFYRSPFSKWPPQCAKIQHCSISKVAFNFLRICAVLWLQFWKWRPVEIVRCQESIWDIIIYPHMKCRWNRTMLNLCSIVVAILKMATSRNFSMSGINSGHHNLPTYEMSLKSDNVAFVQYC